jgi:hypothetical protein
MVAVWATSTATGRRHLVKTPWSPPIELAATSFSAALRQAADELLWMADALDR